MDEEELEKLFEALSLAVHVDAQLNNFKSRSDKAAKELQVLYKKNKEEYASLEPLAEAMSKLSKAQPAASKAVAAIEEFGVSVKKKPDQFALVDVKKKLKKLLKNVATVDDRNADVLDLAATAKQKVRGLQGLLSDNTDAYVILKTYSPEFRSSFSNWKAAIDAL